MIRLLTVRLAREEDVVIARQRARQVAEALGFDGHDQTRIATAVSEIARNAFVYAGGGQAEFGVDPERRRFGIAIEDGGPGIPHLARVLDGSYRSDSGMGLGIAGSRRVMDDFDVESRPGRTVVRMGKGLPRQPPTQAQLGAIVARLATQGPRSFSDEMQQQNHELLAALEELRLRQDELSRLNVELQDTNRGVLALYAELDEKAEHLRRADAMKSKFLSHMSHEFQTPLNSMLALTRLLLDRADGDLTPEQERQVSYIRDAVSDLSQLVADLLDLAKVEAGKIVLRPGAFSVTELFATLRGLMRPLRTTGAVALVFESAEGVPPMYTDEGKVSQILRNYISNALKFTERGEVRVSAEHTGGAVAFRVSDTGIGIEPRDQARLFQEFGMVPNRLQAKVRGTGLGLSLSKRLAELLGGRVGVTSVPGEGSTFSVTLPLVAPGFEPDAARALGRPAPAPDPAPHAAPTALVVDDEQTSRYLLRRFLTAAGCRVIEAAGGQEGLARAAAERPDVVFLDLMMPDMLGTEVLARLKRDPATADIPVIIATSRTVDEAERHRLVTHAVALLPKSRIGSAGGDADLRDALHAAGIHTPA